MSPPPADDGGRERFLTGLLTTALDDYDRAEIGLARLVADVENAIEALLDVADEQWVEQLRSAWSGLEIVYALALDAGRSTLTDAERAEVRDTVEELRSLLP